MLTRINNKFSELLLSRNKSCLDFSFNLNKTCDTHIGVDLYFNGEPLAKIGISYGLEDYYYGIEDYGGNLSTLSTINQMIKSSKEKWGVTLLQSTRGKRNLRKEFNELFGDYRFVLMRSLEDLAKESSISISFYIPGEWVFWNFDLVKEFNSDGSPDRGFLRKNYDEVAKRFGFKFNKESNLYER